QSTNKSMSILQARSRRAHATQVVDRQCAITFGHRRLPNVIATEIANALGGSECGESFARINLTRRRDRFDSRGATDVRPAVVPPSGDRIVKFVNRPSVQCDPQ